MNITEASEIAFPKQHDNRAIYYPTTLSLYRLIKAENNKLTPHIKRKMDSIPRIVSFESFKYSNNLLPTNPPAIEHIITDIYNRQSSL